MTAPTRKRSLDQRARDLSDKALDTLEDIMDNGAEARDRLRAATEILDRGYGKAAQAVIAIPATQRARIAAAAYSNEELDAIIDAEWEAITSRSEAKQLAITSPEIDPLLK